MKIVFDLDSVLRDLEGYLWDRLGVPKPTVWVWRHLGKDIFEWVEGDDFNSLVYSPTTEYYLTIKKYVKNIEIWTNQPHKWRTYTDIWLKNHFGDKYLLNYLTTDEKQKRLNGEKGTYLVEDCPNFTDYSRILLIDYPYNRHIDAPNRITKPEELEVWLKRKYQDET